MGLDVYVGPLQRFLTREWKTVAQREAEEQGIKLFLKFAEDRKFLTKDIVGEAVEEWLGLMEADF
jgi:hypothetical protein